MEREGSRCTCMPVPVRLMMSVVSAGMHVAGWGVGAEGSMRDAALCGGALGGKWCARRVLCMRALTHARLQEEGL